MVRLFLVAFVPISCTRHWVVSEGKPQASELTHGERQMQRILQERLEMNQYSGGGETRYVTSEDSIFRWAAQKFGTADGTLRFFWNRRPPTGRASEHRRPIDGHVGWIALADYTGTSIEPAQAFDCLWRGIFFELLDISKLRKVEQVRARAAAGLCDENTFFRDSMAIEYEALMELKSAYETVWLPWCQRSGFESQPRYWATPTNPVDQWIDGMENQAPAFRKHFAAEFAAIKAGVDREPLLNNPGERR